MESISSCRICGSKRIEKFFDLGNHPPANALKNSADAKEDFYPLSLSWCLDCSLVQLNETVDPEKLFSRYLWVTGTSKAARDFSEVFCRKLLRRSNISGGDYVLELGSNDGTFLKPFIKRRIKVLGIDPAQNIAEIANQNGIHTECLFFGLHTAERIADKYGKAKVVIARNVMYHVPDINDFVGGLSKCLKDDEGILVAEIHYARVVLKELHYDSIYHEHLFYYTVKTFKKLLEQSGLYIFDIQKSPINNGNIVVYAKKRKPEESGILTRYLSLEEKYNVNSLQSWKMFSQRALRHKIEFKKLIDKAREKGVVTGYGSSARSSTLLNYCGINSDLIDSIADDNPLKQGLFTAGSSIPIESFDKMMQRIPKTLVLLAWNFADDILKKVKERYSFSGQSIIPLPNYPKMIEI